MMVAKNTRSRRSRPLNSDINVTPFVDVVLVLLIVFMVAAPLMTVGVPVDLPKAQAKALSEKTEPLTISVKADGTVFLMETPIDLDTLVPKLQAIQAINTSSRVYIRGDQAIHFGLILKIMAKLSMAGFEKVGLVASSPTGDAVKKSLPPAKKP